MKIFLYVAGAVVLILAMVGIWGYWKIQKEAPAVDLRARAFLLAASTLDQSKYGPYVSPAFKEMFENFIKLHANNFAAIQSVEKRSGGSYESSTKTGQLFTYNATVTYKDGRTQPIILTFHKEENEWQVYGVKFEVMNK